MIRYCVTLTLQLPGSVEGQLARLKQIENLLRNLPEQILELESMEVLLNYDPSEESTFVPQVGIEDLEVFSTYATHLAHT